MSHFIDFLKNGKIIDKCTEYYKNNIKSNSEICLLEKILKKFEENFVINTQSKFREISNLNLDLISGLYQNSKNHKNRKDLGEFFTPFSIVKYILDGVSFKAGYDIKAKSVIDISCGAGSFIIEIIARIIEQFKVIYNKPKISDFTLNQAKEVINSIKNNVVGVDVNPIACILCQINIYFVLYDILKLIKLSEPNFEVPVFNIQNSNSLQLEPQQNFDFVVGNPPYIFIRDIHQEDRLLIENSGLETNKGQYDFYQIFIELGVKLLKTQGKLGYIIPDSLLVLSNRSNIRKYLYYNTKIKQIYHIGQKFQDPIVSNIILILEKELDEQKRLTNKIKLNISEEDSHEILQRELKLWNYKFLIHLDKKDREIIRKINTNFPKLKDLSEDQQFTILLNRGVELTKKGTIIYCEICKRYYPVPKTNLICPECHSLLQEDSIEQIIKDRIPPGLNSQYLPFIQSIKRYNVETPKYIDISKSGINYKESDLYKDRIIIRQLSQDHMICATHVDSLALNSQSIYNLKIIKSPIKLFNNKYLLGLINSMLMSFLFIKLFGLYKKLFPRILIQNIKDFPIVIPKSSHQKELAKSIIKNVDILLNKEYRKPSVSDKIQLEIDSLVFQLYNIYEKEQEHIINYMANL